jgi:two-component system, chemotaxis family, sensor kinase Cph1
MIQLFQNLIGNAIKYHSEEPPRIRVSAEKKEAEWVFSVSDNGIGIDPRHASQVFRVFKRLHPPGKYPGTGIGLAICQKIVERYGGRIWVDQNFVQPDKAQGSIFRFTVPVEVA